MGPSDFDPPPDRARVGWWLYVAVLGAAAAFIAYSFVGMIVLGVFGYYATRPIRRWFERVVDSRNVAVLATVLLVVIPLVVLLVSVGFRAVRQARSLLDASADSTAFGGLLEVLSAEQREQLTATLRNPERFLADPDQALETAFQVGVEAIAAVFGGLLLVSLSVTLAYFLLQNDRELAAGLRRLFGGRDTTAFAYVSAVDEDLESVFFGNVLFVVVVSLLATLTYWGTNAVAPDGLQVPMIFVLGFLTGVASLIPVVVGKVVYVPVLGFLALRALSLGGDRLQFVAVVAVVYFLVLDLVPQTFLQPYITGRQLDVVLLLFAYLLGPILFGWYGFFLLPIVFVLLLEAIRIVLPQLIHGEPVTASVEMGESVGTTPREEREAVPDERTSEEAEAATNQPENASDGEPSTRSTTGDSADESA